MGFVCSSEKERKYPNSGLYNYDSEKEKLIINLIGKINFKDLFLEGLTPEFLKLFQENSNLYYFQSFLEGISYEHGLFGKSKDIKKAFKIYKEAADFKYDYLCMYRMHRIFLTDYEYFNIKKNGDLHRLYLYKCFAYLPSFLLDNTYHLLNKINVAYELAILLDKCDDNNTFDEFMDFLNNHKKEFNISSNDIKLMKSVFNGYFYSEQIEENIEIIDSLLDFEKGDKAHYEAKLKYCYFYLKHSGESCVQEKVKNVFEDLILSGYYKACLDYGRFLLNEQKYDEAKIILKKGFDNCQYLCNGEYIFLILSTTDFKQILSDYNIISYLLKNMCVDISFIKLGQTSFYYQIYYLIKHSSFKENILNDFVKYAIEIFQIDEKNVQSQTTEFINEKFAEKYIIQIPCAFGCLCYYGISDIIKSDKERALIYFKKSYQLSKEKEYNSDKIFSYLYIYKCRKFLLKNNKISIRKLNKTKEKLFRFYEDSNLNNLDAIEAYNYYKLYKIGVYGNTQSKLISILKRGKNIKLLFHFREFVYREKCRIALEKEYSNSSLNQNNIILKNENSNNKNIINIFFRSMEGNQYNIQVPKNLQFIVAIHNLYTKYPELETKKIGTYVCNGNKICIFDTMEENEIKEGNIIIIINKVDKE